VVNLLSYNNVMDRINKKEYRVVGLKRSGNHVIINWIIKQQPGTVVFLNNVPPFRNPYTSHSTDGKIIRRAPGQTLKKGELPACVDALIYSHEDCRLNYVASRFFEKNHDEFLGESEKRYDVLVLRDPFNLFASRLHRDGKTMPSASRTMNLAHFWIAYAREYLEKTNHLTNNKITINYNRWCIDQEYRRQLADLLELKFSDNAVNEVPTYGRGSSFDGMTFQGKASEMKVLERWKILRNDNRYLGLFRDRLVVDLSEKIFGKLPDMDSFITTKLTPNFSYLAALKRRASSLLTGPASSALYLRETISGTRSR